MSDSAYLAVAILYTVALRKPTFNHYLICAPLHHILLYYATGFVKTGLNTWHLRFLFFSTGRLHGALGCRLPNLEAAAEAIFATSV